MPPQAKLVAPIAIKVEASAQKLDAKDSGITGKSDPFFEVVAQPAGFSKPIKLYRSETIYKNLNPKWREFVLNSDDLRGLDTPFEIRVYDEDKDGGHDLIGSLKTTLRDCAAIGMVSWFETN
jgi:Ca2+-dependent lipid-binding protein